MLEKFITLMIVGRKDDEKGATATEYGLLVGLIALIIVVGVGLFGDALNGFFEGLADTVDGW
ncbi:pilus assembly protein Flp/PilA [Nocardioides cavernae]|uniref:Pilus assembly protein Flp/PilA n=1 Tax=Nocardioides cavernae TaxID=1921566 RepID=A0A7Y9KRM1_9ACTN|nr:Flp family type IVb pilin [Nocardioides cavernae]NYE38906.1 pilus assembly protein Flp/PilA [Nocardioides cavernae]